jgi:uncharacterized protein (TIGR04255 family)
MGEYVPALQDALRRQGYPVEQEGQLQHLTLTPAGLVVRPQARWEYRSRDGTRAFLVTDTGAVFLTTEYSRFEEFADTCASALAQLLDVTEQREFGALQRLGLRFVNRISPADGKDHRFYLQAGLCGMDDSAFPGGGRQLKVEQQGATKVRGGDALLTVRVTQNRSGADLPPDLLSVALPRPNPVPPGALITLLDMDHVIQFADNRRPDVVEIVEFASALHDVIVETFHDHVVTPAAIEEWR